MTARPRYTWTQCGSGSLSANVSVQQLKRSNLSREALKAGLV
jgi:hypothetical protein